MRTFRSLRISNAFFFSIPHQVRNLSDCLFSRPNPKLYSQIKFPLAAVLTTPAHRWQFNSINQTCRDWIGRKLNLCDWMLMYVYRDQWKHPHRSPRIRIRLSRNVWHWLIWLCWWWWRWRRRQSFSVALGSRKLMTDNGAEGQHNCMGQKCKSQRPHPITQLTGHCGSCVQPWWLLLLLLLSPS